METDAIIEKVMKKINNLKKQHCDNCERNEVCNMCFKRFMQMAIEEAIEATRAEANIENKKLKETIDSMRNKAYKNELHVIQDPTIWKATDGAAKAAHKIGYNEGYEKGFKDGKESKSE